jgi:hypothetical protein
VPQFPLLSNRVVSTSGGLVGRPLCHHDTEAAAPIKRAGVTTLFTDMENGKAKGERKALRATQKIAVYRQAEFEGAKAE